MTDDWFVLQEILESTPNAVTRSGLLDGGRRSGSWRSWRADGSLAVKASFRGGRRQGAWTRWHPNGRLAVRLRYHRGLADGLLEAWYPDGGRALQAELASGLLNGPFTTWRQDGTAWATGAFHAGVVEWKKRSRTIEAVPERTHAPGVGVRAAPNPAPEMRAG